LWAFNIVPPRDGHGKAVIPNIDDLEGSFSLSPRPFTFLLEPRKDYEVKSLISSEYEKAEEEALKWM